MAQDHNPIEGLTPFRQAINELDDKLIDLLAERLRICAEVAAYKRQYAIAMMQPDRVEAVKHRCAERAISRGVDAAFARDLYDLIIGEACALETRIIES